MAGKLCQLEDNYEWESLSSKTGRRNNLWGSVEQPCGELGKLSEARAHFHFPLGLADLLGYTADIPLLDSLGRVHVANDLSCGGLANSVDICDYSELVETAKTRYASFISQSSIVAAMQVTVIFMHVTER
ncbi:hypothetical protein N7460_008965 [Penicillium canescens]|uniref:Uncharacterized protein n=1 Tax=Penicillium canescens TaxID=5083 RepID=A0AAD6I6G1_PENCN|nr:hypothetical protein N7460_008965 [Penicillium canescens]KAJ6046453.1 hypothetical protein N7444_007707 [Penicillium canescens]